MSHTNRRPNPEEFPAYYKTYVDKVSEENFVQLLKKSATDCLDFLQKLPADKWNYRYAPDKWSIKEVVLHMIDTERIMGYRALRISRGDKTPLPGFDQDAFVPFSKADARSPQSLISEYEAVRQSSIQLFEHFDDSHLETVGTASGNAFTPRALGFVIVGHELHHLEVLRERYVKYT